MRAVIAAVFCVCGLAGQSAQATFGPAPTFDFYAHGGPVLDQTSTAPHFIAGDLDLTVKAFVGSTQALVDLRWDGLGVTTNSFFNTGEITQGETLQLSFNKAVTLSGLGFSLWDNGLFDSLDHATLSWGGKSLALGNSDTIGLVNVFKLNNVVGTTFTLTGTGLLSHFRLAGIQAQAVPEPATWGLMALGLAGVAAVRRRTHSGSRRAA